MSELIEVDESEPPGSLERAEAIAGLLLFGISSGSLMSGCIWVARRGQDSPAYDPRLFITITVGFAIATIGSFAMLARGIAISRSPILVQIAENSPGASLPRAVLCTWWGWQFASMSVAADMFWQEYRLRHVNSPEGFSDLLIRVLVTAAANAAANMFLLLALGSLGTPRNALHIIHRFRFVLDLLIAIVVVAAPADSFLIFQVPFMFLFRVIFPK